MHKPYLIHDNDVEVLKKYENNLSMANIVKNAIYNNRIISYYQPIFDTQNNIIKYEALVRLEDEKGTILSPYLFLELSQKIKLYSKITETMIEKTFKYFSKNKKDFSLNLSFDDILNEKTNNYLFDMIKKYNIANQLTIEILETQSLTNEKAVLEFIDKLYSYGAKIAIDDFGSGFANFEYMTKVQSDYIKIDGSLIKDIDKNENSKIVVETIILFAKKLGKKTVAEFVHSKEIYDIVKKLGVDYIQGYYLSEPKPSI
jgi:EAL domain-containing protein (putative c-di-GMP-specific phosphodiesterase class I)